MHPLLAKQQQLHTEATELLNSIVLPVLEDFGEVTIGGSYAYALLSHPDIDIDVAREDLSKDVYADLCRRFLALSNVSKMTTTDRVAYPHKYPGVRPTGYWIAPRIHYGEHTWELDIWLQKPEWQTGATIRYTEKLKDLDDEKRTTILSLKEELRGMGIYGIGKEFESVDVYDAVLDGDIRTVAALRTHKQGMHSG